MNPFVLFSITLCAFLAVVAGMAVGVMLGRRSISGSCGGLANNRDTQGNSSCSLCSNPDAACRELGRRMQGQDSLTSSVENSGTRVDSNESECAERTRHSDCDKNCEAQGCTKEEIDACKNG